jgi:hypothetical protein
MANIRISQLPTAPTAITGAELIPIVQNGETVQTTVSAIVNSPTQTQTFLTKNNEPTLPNSRYFAATSDFSLTDGGSQSTYQIGLTGALANLNALGNGVVVKSGTTLINRSLAISGNGLAVSNADGTSGNPTISLINNLANIAGANGTGILGIAGNNSLNIITIAGTANQINVANGSTSPVISIVNNPILPGTASVTLPTGNTAARPSPVAGMLRYNSETSTFEGYSAGAWGAIITGSGVSSFSAGSTGLTPSTGTTGGIVLAGTLNASSGGSGVAGTLTGILYGNGTSVYTVATTAQLLSGVGTVPIANGGTGQTTAITAFNALSPLTTSGDLLYANATNSSARLGIGSTGQILTVVGGFPAWSSLSASAVTSFSAGSTGLLPTAPTTGAVTLTGTLNISNGGTGLTSNPANGQLLIGNGSSYTLATLTAGAGISVTNTSGGITIAVNGTGEVTSFQTSLSGLTPSTATGGAVTLAGTLGVTSGGTSYTSYTIGDMLYANTTTTFSKLGVGASGYILSSTGSSPNWIQTLPVSNGGTGLNTLTAGYIPYGNGASAFGSISTFNYNTTNNTLNAPTIAVSSVTSVTPVLSFNAANTSFASGATVANNYLQFLQQNKSGTAGASTNYVLSNDLGTDSSYYGEFGMNSSVFSASIPADFFSINNGVYFSAHDGDVSVGSGNGYKTYLTYGTSGQSAHVINAAGAIGFSTNLGTTPALSGTTGFGTAGQVMISGGSAAAPSWGSVAGGGF